MARSPVELLAQALDEAGGLVDGVAPHQWERPTPCTAWSVRDVVEHLTAGNHATASALRDGPGQVGTSVPKDFKESADELLRAFAEPGAVDRVVAVPLGRVPGVVALHLRLVEALVHGWDLARATGQAARFDDETAERALAFTLDKLADVPADRSPFGPPQPVAADAPALDRLAACLGRTVDR